ncbi:MAG: type II secretion system protein [Phycisphaerales bacterium]
MSTNPRSSKSTTSQYTAFSMLELALVTAVIGIVAIALVPHFASAQRETVHTSTAKDLRNIASALAYYKGMHGSYPVNGTRAQDAAMLQEYFKGKSPFLKEAPIGGVYDYLGPINGNPIAIEIVQEGNKRYTFETALELDSYIDNGDLESGRLVDIGDRLRYRFSPE